ncbi:MAG: hypothetical protein WA001_02740 [Patescibacteria group bacterium]
MESKLVLQPSLGTFAPRVSVAIRPVDLSQPVTLPEPWPRLIARGFHSDLLDRARAFLLLAEREQFVPEATEILRLTGEGFLTPFDRRPFEPAAGDPFADVKCRSLNALDQLSAEFGDRIPATVCQTFAFMATRPNPMERATILSMEKWLPLPWWYADAVLHAIGKVFGLMLHVHSRFYQHTGLVLEHNCDCNHAIQEPGEDGMVRAFLPKVRFSEASAALLSHLLCEGKLIAVDALPFNLGLSPEAAEALALQRQVLQS